jgi:hypothetical protein
MTTVRELIQALMQPGIDLDDEVIAKNKSKRLHNIILVARREEETEAELGCLFG